MSLNQILLNLKIPIEFHKVVEFIFSLIEIVKNKRNVFLQKIKETFDFVTFLKFIKYSFIYNTSLYYVSTKILWIFIA